MSRCAMNLNEAVPRDAVFTPLTLRSMLRCGPLVAAVWLAGCGQFGSKSPGGAPSSSAPAPTETRRAPPERPRPAPSPTPAPAPAPAPTSAPAPASDAEPGADEAPRTGAAIQAEGLRLYRAGQYDAALARFSAVRGPASLRLQALKYSAFSYCVTNRLGDCQRAFEQALQLSPGFRLTRGESGHPVWGPVFTKALGAATPARRPPR